MMSHNDVEVAARTRDVSGRREVRKIVLEGAHSASPVYMWSKTTLSFASASITGVCMYVHPMQRHVQGLSVQRYIDWQQTAQRAV